MHQVQESQSFPEGFKFQPPSHWLAEIDRLKYRIFNFHPKLRYSCRGCRWPPPAGHSLGTLSRGYRALRHNGKEVINVEMSGVLVFARVVVFAREKVALVVAPHLSTRNIFSLLSPPKAKNVEIHKVEI